MMRRLSLALAIGVALAGFRRSADAPAAPSLQIPAAWRADITASPLEGWWWHNFHDSQLNQYVEQALRAITAMC